MPLITIASPKGGVGKTTLAANLAGGLARTGVRVIALDLDPQNALRLHFGVPLDEEQGFATHIAAGVDWRDSLRGTSAGVALLPFGACSMETANILTAEAIRDPLLLVEPVRGMLAGNAWVVADTSPGPSALLSALLPLTDLLVTVMLADTASLSLIPTVENGNAYGADFTFGRANRIGFIVNQYDPRTRLGPSILDGVQDRLGEKLLGIVYRDENVVEAGAAQKLLASHAPTGKAAQGMQAVTTRIMQTVTALEPV